MLNFIYLHRTIKSDSAESPSAAGYGLKLASNQAVKPIRIENPFTAIEAVMKNHAE